MRNRISVIICLILCLSICAFSQQINVSKGTTVVPKFALKWADLDSSWRGFLKAELNIEQNSSGNLIINGSEDWKAIPFFPAYDGSGEGFKASFYKSEYPTPSITAYKIDNIERKKEFTEVKLSKLKDRVVDLKLRFGNSIKDLDKAFNEVIFVGDVENLKKSDFFQKLTDKLLETSFKKELSELPRTVKLTLLEDVNYQANSIGTEVFKEKRYFICAYSDGTEYNTIRVNQAERVARTLQKYFSEIKRKGKLLLNAKEIDGIKVEVKIAYRNFVDESRTTFDQLYFYVPMDSLKLFIEADITDQELVDKSIVLLNDSRVRVNLSQFSN